MRIEENYSLREHNTFGIEAKCRRYVEYSSSKEALQVAAMLRESSTPYIIIGGGSNLLLTKDFDGIVVHSAMKGRRISGCQVVAFSGEIWDDVVVASLEAGLSGAENLSLIPGEVGASAVQNIGAYGVEVKDLIEYVWVLDIVEGRIRGLKGCECGYGYRQSHFKEAWRDRFLVMGVVYRLSSVFNPHLDYGNIRQELERMGVTQPTAQQVREAVISIRQAKLPDPKVEGNAGSFFKNPVVGKEVYERLAADYDGMPHYPVDETHEKIPAGWLIDQCGWKGKSLGRAGVHDKQALVLVNRGGATGQEIVALCQTIQRDVYDKFGIQIQPEVNIV